MIVAAEFKNIKICVVIIIHMIVAKIEVTEFKMSNFATELLSHDEYKVIHVIFAKD